MEMTQESLIAAGFTGDQAKSILDAHKASLTNQYVPKARFDEVSSELTQTKAQVSERDKQIKDLEKFQGTNEELTAKIAQLTQENAQKDQQMQTALLHERMTSSMKLALSGKVQDADIVLSLIKQDDVKLGQDGSLIGFQEQVDALKQSKPFLFVDSTDSKDPQPNGIHIIGKNPPEGDDTILNNSQLSFGAQLAKQQLALKQSAQNAGKEFFKGGN